MNKSGLVEIVSERAGLTRKKSGQIISAALNTITEELVGGGKVQIVGFGAFEVKRREARVGRNPKTKEPVSIPAGKAPVFRPSKALKAAIDKQED